LPVYNSDVLYSAVIKYDNVRLIPSLTSGKTVTAGEEIGYVADEKSCGDITTNYLHFQVTATQNGVSFNVDPLLLIE